MLVGDGVSGVSGEPARLDWLADALTQPHEWVRVLQARAVLHDIEADVMALAGFFQRHDGEEWWYWPDNPRRPDDAEAILLELRQALACWSNIAVAARATAYGDAKDAQTPELYRLGLVPMPQPNPPNGQH